MTFIAACVLIMVMWAGCVKERAQYLPMRARAYHTYYQEKQFSLAAGFVNDPQDFLNATESISDDMVILDFDIVRCDIVNQEGTEAEVEVIRSYHILPSITVKKQDLVQKWKYDPNRRNWFLISPY